jgi:hypothetical protein
MVGRRWTAALALAVAGCGGRVVVDGAGGGTGGVSPIVGVWAGSVSQGSVMEQDTLTFSGDGTFEATLTFSQGGSTCTGTWQVTGTWTATATTISILQETCTAQTECMGVAPSGCDGNPAPSESPCTYTLSSDDETLVITCPNGPALSLAREG